MFKKSPKKSKKKNRLNALPACEYLGRQWGHMILKRTYIALFKREADVIENGQAGRGFLKIGNK